MSKKSKEKYKNATLLNKDYFYNSYNKKMTFDEVFEKIIEFIKQDPYSSYKLSVGTDSQVRKKTYFVSAIHLHRIGKGAIGFLKNHVVPRQITSLNEKISLETTLSQELICKFTNERISQIIDILVPFADKGADFVFEIHLDVGEKGATKVLIRDMVGRIISMGIDPKHIKIKPDSYAASAYANRYTK